VWNGKHVRRIGNERGARNAARREALCKKPPMFNAFLQEYILDCTNKRHNTCAQKPKPCPDDGQQTVPHPQTVMREAYAKITERGLGLL
jgi:hypothetical protein